MGAKNHAIVMPDASMEAALNALVAAGFGAAGQRCMALSTVVFVGCSKSWYYVFPYILYCLVYLFYLEGWVFEFDVSLRCRNVSAASKLYLLEFDNHVLQSGHFTLSLVCSVNKQPISDFFFLSK